MRTLIGVALLAITASAFVVDKTNVDTVFEFHSWMGKFGKKYETTADYDHAFHNYMNTKQTVAALNARPGQTATHGMTKFADMSPAEFKEKVLNAGVGAAAATHFKNKGISVAPAPVGATPPATFDWRSKKMVTPVKDQQQCGSCWAFSTTENFESMWMIAGNKQQILGPEQLVDCDPQSQGCSGGWTYWAFEYLTTPGVGGMESEAAYPYTAGGGNAGPCKFDASKVVATIKNYTFAMPPCESGPCTGQNMNTLREQLATVGPLSICVDAEQWQTYENGILNDCPSAAEDLDHCVQLVGYNWPGKYWIVRNSWNTDWGIEGYIWVSTTGNQCGIGNVVTYADVGAPPQQH